MIWQNLLEKLGLRKSNVPAVFVAESLPQQPITIIERKVIHAQPNGNAAIPVTEKEAETMASIQNQASTTITTPVICKRCGRVLKNPKAKALGFGAICYRRHMVKLQPRPLFELPTKEIKGE